MPRMRLRFVALAFAVGCSGGTKPSPTPAVAAAPPVAPIPAAPDGGATATPPPPPPTQPKPAAKAPKPGTRDLAGLKLEFKKDGTVKLTGKDRWGQKIDTTYESAAYLREAVPVLRRSLSEPQAAALDKLATELAPK
jgi:hypothetical protein